MGKRQQANYMTSNPPFEEDNKKTLTLRHEPKNSKGLEGYIVKLSIDSSWYFDSLRIKHVTSNNDLVSLKNFSHKNNIPTTRGESHHVIEERSMIEKWKTREIKHIIKIFYVPNIKNKLLLVEAIMYSRFNLNFFPNTCLIKNIKTKTIILKGMKVNGKGLYKLEAKPYLNFEQTIISENPNASSNPTITKTII